MVLGGWTGRQPAHLQLYKQGRLWGLTRAARSCNESRKSTQTRFPSKIEATWQGFQRWRGVGVGCPHRCVHHLKSAGSARMIKIKKDYIPTSGSLRGEAAKAESLVAQARAPGQKDGFSKPPGLVKRRVSVHVVTLYFTSKQ